MNKYAKISAVLSIFAFIFILAIQVIFWMQYGMEFETNFQLAFKRKVILAVIAVLSIIHFWFFWNYNKIAQKTKKFKFYFFIASTFLNFLGFIYLLLWVVNLPYILKNPEMKLKRPDIDISAVKNYNSLVSKMEMIKNEIEENKIASQEFYDKILNNKEVTDSEWIFVKKIIEKNDEIYNFILNEDIMEDFNKKFSKEKKYMAVSMIKSEAIEMYYINKMLEKNYSEAIKRYIKLFEVYQKLLESRSSSLLNNIAVKFGLEKNIDFYFENSKKIDVEDLKVLELKKLEDLLQKSYEKSLIHEFYAIDSIFDVIVREKYFIYPLLNPKLLFESSQENFVNMIENYNRLYPERVKYEHEKKMFLVNSVGELIIRLSIPNIGRLKKEFVLKDKLNLLKYIIKNKGKINEKQLPKSSFTGKPIEFQVKESGYEFEIGNQKWEYKE